MARERRTRRIVVEDKIKTLDEKINVYTSKIEALTAEKNNLNSELEEIILNEQKAAEEAEMKEVLKLLKKKKISASELKDLLEKSNVE